jgi:hypothetical protein
MSLVSLARRLGTQPLAPPAIQRPPRLNPSYDLVAPGTRNSGAQALTSRLGCADHKYHPLGNRVKSGVNGWAGAEGMFKA